MAIDPDVGCRFLGTQSPPPLLSSVRCLASCGGFRPRAGRDIAIDRVSWLQAVNGRVGAMGTAVHEMHRVLGPGGKALIIDLPNDASDQAIDATVDEMHLARSRDL
jgi:hypothetical protein